MINMYAESTPSEDALVASRAPMGRENTSPTEGRRRPRIVGELQTQGPPKGPRKRLG